MVLTLQQFLSHSQTQSLHGNPEIPMCKCPNQSKCAKADTFSCSYCATHLNFIKIQTLLLKSYFQNTVVFTVITLKELVESDLVSPEVKGC